jgi:FtsH-binding integral membrane protein
MLQFSSSAWKLGSCRLPHGNAEHFLWKTYRWMPLGLGLTGAVAWLVANTPSLLDAVSLHPLVFYGAMIAEVVPCSPRGPAV